MNHYSSWWDETITLYNKFIDPTTKQTKWFRHVIEGCFYTHRVEKVTVGKTTLNSDVSICRIRVSDKFVDRKSWIALTDSEKNENFTLGAGDIIVAGEISDEIDEYTPGSRSSDLIKDNLEFPGCFTIETVNINVGGGRGNEHYHVRGT